MKRSTLSKLALTLVAAFVFVGANAQTPVQYTQDQTEAIVQTEGISFRLYVTPDPLYSPNYTATGALGANSRWTFTIPVGLTASAPVVSGTAVAQNWVEITNPVASGTDYAVSVIESNTAFACTDAGITTNISVIAAPTAAIATTPGAAWTQVGALKEYYLCAAAADAIAVPQLDITYTEDAKRVANAYDYILGVTVAGYDVNDTEIVAPADVTATFGKSGMQAIADYDASPIAYSTANTMSLLTDGGGALVRTKYVFTLSNISSKTSYLSYFRANTGFTPSVATNYYAVAGQTVTFWLNPAPVTGPIYHIPNNYTF